jgi:hypothetical protein
MSPFSKLQIRSVALGLALFLAIYSLWALVAEIQRPGYALQPNFPPKIAAEEVSSKRLSANVAASIGLVRGDLWADRVLVDAANVLADQAPASFGTDAREAVQGAAQRALLARPIDSRVWLILAALSADRSPERASQQLKMSYYTGPNDKAVIGYRLAFAAQSRMLDDPDLREAMRREIRTILLRAPDLRPVIVAGYRKAQPKDREFIEKTAGAIDGNFAATLRSN